MKHRAWSHEDLAKLKSEYPHTKTSKLAEQLRRPLYCVYNKAMSLNLRKTKEYLASPDACRLRRNMQSTRSIACRFRPGHMPANKGLRRPGWAPGRMCETQFKKGQKPCSWKPIGSERINADGYRDRKISDTGYPPRDWRGIHILMWEEKYGPFPPGYMVCFINGDKTDIRMDKFMLLNQAERMRLNSFHNRYPKEIGRLIQLRGALVRQINRRIRDEKQDSGSARSSLRNNRRAARQRQAA